MSILEVVSAVIVVDDRILLTQRLPHKVYAYCWECPGGKVDGEESHHQALRRELREELDVEVDHINEATVWCGESPRDAGGSVLVLLYRVWLSPGAKPRPVEGQGVGWFSREGFEHLALMPSYEKARPIMLGGFVRREREARRR